MTATRVTGWFVMVMGVGFVIAGIALRHQGGLGVLIPFLIVGILSAVIGLGLVGSTVEAIAKDARLAQVAATGLAGTATITGVETTGTEINGETQYHLTVNVSLPERLIYQATITRLIAPSVFSRYAQGAAFPCRVDPDDLSVVVLINDPAVARSTSAALLAAGVPGQARVLGIFSPPPDDLVEPTWGLRVRIEVDDGRPPCEIRLTTLYPHGQQRPQRGAVLPVRIDPEEPRRVAVDWAAVSAPGSLPRPARETPRLADASPPPQD